MRKQMNNRIRESTDYWIYCSKKRLADGQFGFTYRVYDGYTDELLNIWRTTTEKEKWLYDLYYYKGGVNLVLT
jgi:hypothetical protein